MDADQDVVWTRDAQNNVIGYTIINPKPVTGLRHIVDDGKLTALDIQVYDENATAQTPTTGASVDTHINHQTT